MKDLIAPNAKLEWLDTLQSRLKPKFTENEVFDVLSIICIYEIESAEKQSQLSILKHVANRIDKWAIYPLRSFVSLYGLRVLDNQDGTYSLINDAMILSERVNLFKEFLNLIGISNIPIEHLRTELVKEWYISMREQVEIHCNWFSDDYVLNTCHLLRAYGYGLKLVEGEYLMPASKYDIVQIFTDKIDGLDGFVVL